MTSWFFVIQPNGLLARYSTTVESVTHYNLRKQDALRLASRSLQLKDAKVMVQAALVSPQMTWESALEMIEYVHGPLSRRETEIEACLQEEVA